MILKPKIATAKLFYRVFNQFQKQEPENSNSSEESIQNANRQERVNSMDPKKPPEELEKNKGEISDLITKLEHYRQKSIKKQEKLNTLVNENANLSIALVTERKKTALLQCQLDEEKKGRLSKRTRAEKLTPSSQKNARNSTQSTDCSTDGDYTKQISQLAGEKQKLCKILEEKTDKIYNIGVLFMRLKSSKDVLRAKLDHLQRELDEVSEDLLEKLTEARNEINLIADTRYHTMNDFRNANMIRVVQKNGQLALENSTLRLEMSRLRQSIFDLENKTAVVKVNTKNGQVKTVPSHISVSASSLKVKSLDNAAVRKSFPSYYSKYSGKTVKMSVRSSHWGEKRYCSGNNGYVPNRNMTGIDDRRTVDFVNNLPDTLKYYKKTVNYDDLNEEARGRRNKYPDKTKKRSQYTHHNVDEIFKKNAEESLILQANSVQPNHKLKLELDKMAPESLKVSSEPVAENKSPQNSLRHESARDLLFKRSSEESLLSIKCNLPASKSAPEILQTTEHHFTDDNSE